MCYMLERVSLPAANGMHPADVRSHPCTVRFATIAPCKLAGLHACIQTQDIHMAPGYQAQQPPTLNAAAKTCSSMASLSRSQCMSKLEVVMEDSRVQESLEAGAAGTSRHKVRALEGGSVGVLHVWQRSVPVCSKGRGGSQK